MRISISLGGNGTNEIGPKDADIFRKVTMICVVGIGVLSSVIYHVAVKSPGYKPMLKVCKCFTMCYSSSIYSFMSYYLEFVLKMYINNFRKH